MLPTVKNDPGARLLEDKETTPELSVAVGSTQDTVAPPMFNPIVVDTSSMHMTMGATLSTEKTNKFLLLKEYYEIFSSSHLEQIIVLNKYCT